jgi:hypothetical protein
LKTGVSGLVMTIHTFGNYPDKFHPHLHAIITDGLFNKKGTFYVMPKADLRSLEEIFRAGVFSILKEEGKITDEIIDKLMKWRHSGFNKDNGMRISREDEKDRESVAQKIWEIYPLECPNCGGEMMIISFITEALIIRQILEHLNLWAEKLSRNPPEWGLISEDNGVVRELFNDG